LFLLIGSFGFGQITIWTIGAARTVPKGSVEFGILHPVQVGVTETLEFSSQPLMGLSLAPNFNIKNRWYTGNIMFATQHRYTMPTLLLRAMGDTGRFDFLPDTSKIPYIFTFGNDLLFTVSLGPETIFTWKIGGDFALKTGENSLPEIHKPFLYPRTAVYFNKFVWNLGADIDGNIYKNFNYSADIDFYSVGLRVDDWAIEHKGYFIYNHSVKFAALAGYKTSYGTYPEGRRFFIAPAFDLIFKINAKPPPPVPGLWRRS